MHKVSVSKTHDRKEQILNPIKGTLGFSLPKATQWEVFKKIVSLGVTSRQRYYFHS